jgi:hypothetical protein
LEADEILKRAWEAVKASGVPEPLQEVAFREAVQILQAGEAGTPAAPDKPKPKAKSKAGGKGGTAPEPGLSSDIPDEDTFFSQLTHESGVDEGDLRDVLNYTTDGKVQVTPPTKDLGKSVAQQARTVISLVTGARSKGLGEKPIDAGAVRQELERKHCYQQNNFSNEHLGRLKGYNAGSDSSEIVTTSKWVDDFVAAINQAHGRKPEGES